MLNQSTDKNLKMLDLGCGSAKTPGFIGLDRFRLEEVNIVANLDNGGLPFADNIFDIILAFHSLEHVTNITDVMKEVWRIGNPGSQLCIVAPYYFSSLNIANPYHKVAFNENTPRFFTSSPISKIPLEEYAMPPLGNIWGLGSFDNSDPGFDFRCIRMEFFYFQAYWHLSEREQRQARKKFINVCEQIMYHLIIFKPPLTEEGFDDLKLDLFMPIRLEDRRLQAEISRRKAKKKLLNFFWNKWG